MYFNKIVNFDDLIIIACNVDDYVLQIPEALFLVFPKSFYVVILCPCMLMDNTISRQQPFPKGANYLIQLQSYTFFFIASYLSIFLTCSPAKLMAYSLLGSACTASYKISPVS
jgi:hypothetical protein